MTDHAQQRLHAHHGGEHFHDLMVRSFDGRFGDEFWAYWAENIAPILGEDPTLLDLGCGPGLMLRAWRERYPTAVLHGVELQPYMLTTARELATETKATLHETDLHTLSLPLPDASVDAILCAVVIHELREPIGMLREAKRLLRSTGRLLVMDWVRVPLTQYLEAWNEDPFDPTASPELRADRLDHFMEHCKYSRDDLWWLVERCGLTIETAKERADGQFLWLVARA
ncbi:class I SAM-dependent methyltransferase [Paraliomyxa miuraensis]|uniref:class I SAM-dependent methyltransferase n=1 Tax=Paraliomyxa miuraensis TaxID=376150 RepID=UPI002253FEF9|nr:class I SAM-dependent methyltransferase [Paraliomyxa miuraensis]MCX4242913.1 class I SAM-dependent methyltransferase [Paraliomyxa miuraensis]